MSCIVRALFPTPPAENRNTAQVETRIQCNCSFVRSALQQFKLSNLTNHTLATHRPPCLTSLLHFSNIPRQPRSSTSQHVIIFYIPRTKLNLGKHVFSVAAHWHELPSPMTLLSTALKNKMIYDSVLIRFCDQLGPHRIYYY